MNTILLQPTDVLFFRDGRPMTGASAGHTTAWPLPDVTNHALHAALHRAGIEGVHQHRRGRSGVYQDERDRKFGSLLTAGPFPVDCHERWFFPRPADSHQAEPYSLSVTLRPIGSLTAQHDDPWLGSSLPDPLEYAVGSLRPPAKDTAAEAWLSSLAYAAYLRADSEGFEATNPLEHFLNDSDLADREANLGIAIDPDTQTAGQGATAGKIYTAHYLRLRAGFRLGLLAAAEDKVFHQGDHGLDLVKSLLNGCPTQIVVGGQQRVCTAVRKDAPAGRLPLPLGHSEPSDFKRLPNQKTAVKWVLLSPAIFPAISAKKRDGALQNPHPGGWLPNWIDPQSGRVLLTLGPGVRKAARKGTAAGVSIGARLVAALVPKPLVVTGWALPNEVGRAKGGAKSTHLAVPAGAVYYFEADSVEEAANLANALNWHGDLNAPDFGNTIKNRRSTLLGEKGYGLGVCGTWQFYEDVAGRPAKRL